MGMSKADKKKQDQLREDIIGLIEHGIVFIADMEKVIGYRISNNISAMVKLGMISPVDSGSRDKNCNPIKYYKLGGEFLQRPIERKVKIEDQVPPHYLYEYFPITKPEGNMRIVRLTDERHNGQGLSVKTEFNIQSGIG